MTFRLDFLFKAPKKDDSIISEPVAHIYVKRFHKDKQGRILLGPDCMTKLEIKELVDSLIQELEDLKKKAEKKFEH